MPVSSGTLFHFTNSMENMISILTYDFRTRYSLEDYTQIFSNHPSDGLIYALPMVSFCDIPLSLIGEHVNKYGHYGIGLTKEWGQRCGITPVLYVHQQSSLIDFIWKYIEIIQKIVEIDENEVTNILSFTKPYDGNMWRGKRNTEKITFYDEREWRFVPRDYQWKLLNEKEFNTAETRKWHDSDVWNKYSIKFTPDDIRYLILNRDSEIQQFVKQLAEAKQRFDGDIVKILTTRIITYERIVNDF